MRRRAGVVVGMAAALFVCGATLPFRASAQDGGFEFAGGPRLNIVDVRHEDANALVVRETGVAFGAAGHLDFGFILLQGDFALGRLRPDVAPDQDHAYWTVSGRAGLRPASWLRLQGGADVWQVDGPNEVRMISVKAGAAAEYPLLPGLVVGSGTLESSLWSSAERVGEDVESGISAELGVRLTPSAPVALGAAYRLSWHALVHDAGSEQSERIMFDVRLVLH